MLMVLLMMVSMGFVAVSYTHLDVYKRQIEFRLSVTHGDDTTTHYSQENIKSWHKQVLGLSLIHI